MEIKICGLGIPSWLNDEMSNRLTMFFLPAILAMFDMFDIRRASGSFLLSLLRRVV